MTTLSPLQILLLHIVKIIVDHIVGSSRLKYAGVETNSLAYRELLGLLLWVCHNFCTISLPRFAKHHTMELSTPTGHVLDKYWVPIHLGPGEGRLPRNPNNDMYRLAQELTIIVFGKDVYSGEALRQLPCTPYSGCVFSLVRKINFEFSMARADEVNELGEAVEARILSALETEANISCFVQRIKEMVPKVSNIEVQAKEVAWEFKGSNCFFSDLVWRLFQLAKRVAYNDHDKPLMPLESQQNQICDLVHIQYSMEASNDPFTQLTRRNALTLQSLKICSVRKTELGTLIQGIDGSYTTFPQLHTLYRWIGYRRWWTDTTSLL